MSNSLLDDESLLQISSWNNTTSPGDLPVLNNYLISYLQGLAPSMRASGLATRARASAAGAGQRAGAGGRGALGPAFD